MIVLFCVRFVKGDIDSRSIIGFSYFSNYSDLKLRAPLGKDTKESVNLLFEQVWKTQE